MVKENVNTGNAVCDNGKYESSVARQIKNRLYNGKNTILSHFSRRKVEKDYC